MTDLDNRFLKKNIPGKYTWWDDDDDQCRRQHGESDKEDNDDYSTSNGDFRQPSSCGDRDQVRRWDADGIPKPLQVSALAGACNTGVKGVLSDYRDAKAEESRLASAELAEREELLRRTTGAAMASTSLSTGAEERHRADRLRSDGSGGDDCGGDSSSDDEFLEQYRRQRLCQLQSSSAWPTFGEISEVTPTEYAELVDSVDPRVFLVVHLYDPSVRECKALNRQLEAVARRMPHAKFVRLLAFDARPNLDPVCLPALLMHRGGKLVHNLVRWSDQFRDGFNAEDVQWALETLGAVDPRSTEASIRSSTGSGQTFAAYSRVDKAFSSSCNNGSIFSGEPNSDDAELEEFCRGFESSNI